MNSGYKFRNFIRLFFTIVIICNYIILDAQVRSVGKILFRSESGKEIMIFSSMENPAVILSKGSVLSIGSDSKSIPATVADISGVYIRCTVEEADPVRLKSVKEGADVFYSDEKNVSVKYGDVKKVLNGLIKLYEDFIYSVDTIENPANIAAAVNTFSSELENMIPEMVRLNDKYPELKNFNITPPSELKYESEVLMKLEPRLRDAFYKIQLYSGENGNENVKKAVLNLQRVLEKMKTGKQ